jgi:signal transduction histidine kinase
MVRLFIVLIFLVTVQFQLRSQNRERIDFLKREIDKSDGVTRFEVINDLAWEYRFASPDSTIYFAQQADSLGKELKLGLGMARPINFIGVAYNYKGDKITSYRYYSKALEIATAQRDSLQTAHSKNNLGRLFFDQGLLARSYPHFMEALQLFEAMNDLSGMAYVYQSLANLYRTQKDFIKSEENLLKALNIRLQLKNTRDIQSAYAYIGRMFQEKGDLPKSNYFFAKGDSASTIIKDEINIAEMKTFMAENYLLENKLNEAEIIFKQAFSVIQRINNIRLYPRSHNIHGLILLKKGVASRAKVEFNKALEWAIKIKELESQMEAYYNLSKVAAKVKNKQDELINYNKYLLIKDSLNDLDVARQVERVQFELRIQREEQENALLKLQKKEQEATIANQQAQNIVLIVVAISLLVVGLISWRSSKKRQEANTRLAKQNAEIESQRVEILQQNEELARQNHKLSELNHEKDTLMSIVAHDLKSPLHRIRGLVEVIRLEGGFDDEKKKLLGMIETSAQSGLQLITDLLDVHEIEENLKVTLSSIEVGKLLQQRVDAFRTMAVAKGIDIKLEPEPMETIKSNEDHLNRILDNLISNAIKFSAKGTVITIRSGEEDSKVWFSVKDQGLGFIDTDKKLLYQKFKRLSARPTGGESSNGLGLAIVKTLVERLQGEIILNTLPGKGSEFIVKLPK